MQDLEKVLKERRSVSNFIKGINIYREELNEIFRSVTMATSCH